MRTRCWTECTALLAWRSKVKFLGPQMRLMLCVDEWPMDMFHTGQPRRVTYFWEADYRGEEPDNGFFWQSSGRARSFRAGMQEAAQAIHLFKRGDL